MVPKMPDSCLTAGCFVFYSLNREERNGDDQKTQTQGGKEMRIEKKVLNDALRILGKMVCQTSPAEVFRGVRFVGTPGKVLAMATDGVEQVSLRIDAEVEGAEDFFVEYRALREMVRTAKGSRIELKGRKVEYPAQEAVPADATVVELPVEFAELLASAAPIINRNEPRAVLRGVNLSKDGITVTDGKQLLNLPCSLALKESITIPFPSALLAARLHDAGTLAAWTSGNSRLFQITIGNFIWYGKAPSGNYPNWSELETGDTGRQCTRLLHYISRTETGDRFFENSSRPP